MNQPNTPIGPRSLLTILAAFGLLLTVAGFRAFAAEEKGGAGDKVVLFDGKDLNNWKTVDEKLKDHWKVVGAVKLDEKDPSKLAGSGAPSGESGVMVLEKAQHGLDIFTEQTFGDCEVHVEFMVPKHSNSGVYLMGQYEVQVFDSFGAAKVDEHGCSAIYGVKAPSENAAKAPGEWQSFDIVFRAPRFGANGKKTENARFISVTWNGKKVIENVDVKGPTGSQLPGGEKPKGPLMFQGDHGPVAYRNVWAKAIELK